MGAAQNFYFVLLPFSFFFNSFYSIIISPDIILSKFITAYLLVGLSLFGIFCVQIGQDLEEDPRLKAMKKEWFEGKDCLDIGCNSGVITIAIGKSFLIAYLFLNWDFSLMLLVAFGIFA